MPHSNLQVVARLGDSGESEREHQSRGVMDRRLLRQQNRAYQGSGGVSRNNRSAGFSPGYLDSRSGEAMLSCFANGQPAPIHVLEGLPEAWVSQRDAQGQVLCARSGVIAGFIRAGRFYSREQAARAVATSSPDR